MALSGGRDAAHFDLSTGGARDSARYLPLYEAKMIHQFDHRWATYDGADSRDVTLAEKQDPDVEPTPVIGCQRPRSTTASPPRAGPAAGFWVGAAMLGTPTNAP